MLIFYSRGLFTAETLLNDYRCTATAGSCGIRGAKIKKKIETDKIFRVRAYARYFATALEVAQLLTTELCLFNKNSVFTTS